MSDWILTYTGKKFFPMRPQIEDICIEDIAHALSNICRFTGHCNFFYSVAQHSYYVAHQVACNGGNKPQRLAGLLHDASEAYLCDIARPVKYTPSLFEYRVAEQRLQKMIYERFNVVPDESLIKQADNHLLSVERYFLLPKHSEWERILPASWERFHCMLPSIAEEMFLHSFNRLRK